ncbi:MAG TPA: GntR family transcriptional regulator [Burkholderiaceae bacterium]
MKRLNSEAIVVTALKRDIAQGTLAPGTPLLQDELAARFRMSRVPIRDAIKALEAEGMVEVLPNRTAMVVDHSRADIEEIFSMRAMLECDLLRRASALASAADHEAVSEIVAMLDAVRTGERFAQLDRELHEALYTPAFRPRQQEIVNRLGQQVARFYASSLELQGYFNECQGGHHEIVSAFLKRDSNGAVKALASHLRAAELKVLGLVKAQE